jgi:signal transduction histidine kinase
MNSIKIWFREKKRRHSSESEKINQTGVGFGLAISQNLVKILNNHSSEELVSVESVNGERSVFSFIIHPFRLILIKKNYY